MSVVKVRQVVSAFLAVGMATSMTAAGAGVAAAEPTGQASSEDSPAPGVVELLVTYGEQSVRGVIEEADLIVNGH